MDEFLETVPVLKIGEVQTIVLPKDVQFDYTELKLRKLGKHVIMLFPEDKAGEILREAFGGLPDDLLDDVEISS